MFDREQKKLIDDAHAKANIAMREFQGKRPIVKAGKVIDHACYAGRIARFFNMTETIDQSDPATVKKLKNLLADFEAEVMDAKLVANKAVDEYVNLCIFLGTEPKKLELTACDCGHCLGNRLSNFDVLWIAEANYRRAVWNMIIAKNNRPDFSNDMIAKVKEAWTKYRTYADMFDHEIDSENLFYGVW